VRRITARASRHLPQPPERVFEYVLPVDLSTVIKRWGPLPGVKGTRDQTGEWDHVGATRTVLLEDGSSSREELTAYNPPHHFGYTLKLGPPTSVLASEAAGTWWFRPTDDGGTEIEWAWALAPQPGLGPVISGVLAPMWERYADQALAAIGAELAR
jgi:uncharacterized protein YndB with AHSA1/START domain